MKTLEIKKVTVEDQGNLDNFFRVIGNDDASKQFHPHAFTSEEAQKIASYAGKDLYYILLSSPESILGYCMLRGWDEGYDIPSLGIIIHPDKRGTGLGKLMMQFLEHSARERSAPKIMLKVYPDNLIAKSLYEKLGYIFDDEMRNGQLVGFKAL